MREPQPSPEEFEQRVTEMRSAGDVETTLVLFDDWRRTHVDRGEYKEAAFVSLHLGDYLVSQAQWDRAVGEYDRAMAYLEYPDYGRPPSMSVPELPPYSTVFSPELMWEVLKDRIESARKHVIEVTPDAKPHFNISVLELRNRQDQRENDDLGSSNS